jgi:hypothetical protein
MRLRQWRRTGESLVVVLCVVVVGLSGCSDPPAPAPPPGDGSAGRSGGGPGSGETTDAPSSGIYAFNAGRDGYEAFVFDPASGARLQTIQLGRMTLDPTRFDLPFSTDRRYFANIENCAIRIRKWNGVAYAEHALHAPTSSFAGTKVCYSWIHFADGRFRALAGDADGPWQLVSVEPADAAAKPRVEVDNLSRRTGTTTVDGGTMKPLSYSAYGDYVVPFVLASTDGNSGYRCDQRRSSNSFVCTAVDRIGVGKELAGQPLGSVVTATVDVVGDTVAITQLAGKTAIGVVRALLSPDGKTVLVQLDSGWFRSEVGSPEPTQAFAKLDLDPSILPTSILWSAWL